MAKQKNQKLGKLLGYDREGSVIRLHYEGAEASVDILREDLIKLFVAYESGEDESYAVEEDFHQDVDITLRKGSGARARLTLKTGRLSLVIGDDFTNAIYDTKGNLLAASGDKELVKPARMTSETEEKLGGIFGAVSDNKTVMEEEGHENPLEKIKQVPAFIVTRQMHEDEHFYGLGDKTGFLDKRGYAFDNWNSDIPQTHTEQVTATYKSIPFLIVRRDQGVIGFFYDNPCRSHIDLGRDDPELYYYQANGGNHVEYILYSPDMVGLVSLYTELTGRQPLPQLWTLGYQQSRLGYDSARVFRRIADQMRAYRIPCDAIHFDIDYMDGYRVFTWDRKYYGDCPQELLKDLHKRGFHAVPIIDPGVKKDPGYAVYDEGIKGDYFARDRNGQVYVNAVWPGDTVFPDFGRRQVRDWWAGKEKILTDWGFDATWDDMNEPASFRGELPDDVCFHREDQPISHAKIHNVYGYLMSKATSQGLRKANDKRPFVITRATYAGGQKYATVWTGDNQSIWSHLQMMIPQLCNLGLSGFSLAGTDIGGFSGDANGELMARWIEAAVFSPLFRNHSAVFCLFQEPWQFTSRVLDIYREYVELRYRLLPYLYDLCRVTEFTGLPLMRPLVLHYPNDPNVFAINDQFLVGEDLMAAPVVDQGKTRRLVYFPQGTWYDYFTGTVYEGGSYQVVSAALDQLPLFARAGAIIPNWEVMQYVGEREYDSLILKVFPGRGSYRHYRDNGEDFDYRQGKVDIYEFIQEDGRLIGRQTVNGYGHPYAHIRVEEPLGGNSYELK